MKLRSRKAGKRMRRCRFSIGSAPLTSITKSDAQISGGETRQGRPRHPANASQTNKKIYSPVHRFCDPITTTFGDFTGFQWRNCRSFSWGHNNSWPVNYRSDPGRFSGIKTWDFEAQAGKSRTARLSGARNEALW